MSNTKKHIRDSVLYALAGGIPTPGFPIQERDVWAILDDKINAILRTRQFDTNLPSGETIHDNLVIATYEDVAVTRTSNERSKCTLPVMPISLPRNAGINEIRPVISVTNSGDRILGNPIIPMQAGQDFLLQSDKLLNGLLGQWGYTPNSRTVIFSKDLTVYDITKVDIKLVVFDIAGYSTTEPLPIPTDYTDQLIKEAIGYFAPILAKSGIVSNFVNPTQNIPK